MKLLRYLLVAAFGAFLLWQGTVFVLPEEGPPEGLYIEGEVLFSLEEVTISGVRCLPWGERVLEGQALSRTAPDFSGGTVPGEDPYARHRLRVEALAAYPEGNSVGTLLRLAGCETPQPDRVTISPAPGVLSPRGIIQGDTWWLLAELPFSSQVGAEIPCTLLSGVGERAVLVVEEKSPEGLWLLSSKDHMEAVASLRYLTVRVEAEK